MASQKYPLDLQIFENSSDISNFLLDCPDGYVEGWFDNESLHIDGVTVTGEQHVGTGTYMLMGAVATVMAEIRPSVETAHASLINPYAVGLMRKTFGKAVFFFGDCMQQEPIVDDDEAVKIVSDRLELFTRNQDTDPGIYCVADLRAIDHSSWTHANIIK